MPIQVKDDTLLRDPVVLAIAVIADRIRALPAEDRNDLFDLVKVLQAGPQTDEEYDAAGRAMREILDQSGGSVQVVSEQSPCEGLSKWMGYVGERIKHFREQAGLTQTELEDKSGLPQSHISRLERGQHSPSAMTLEKLAKALGIAPSELDPSA